MFKRILLTVLAVTIALVLNACGGGSGGSGPDTGQVSVLLTDGPTDQYERILISMTRMTLIGPGGHVDLYDGPEITFDLLEMSEWGDLAFTSKVRAGRYNKIRLELSKVELVDLADNSVERLNKLPANGKIDLNPRGQFRVGPDHTTVIQIDMDAKRSFQVVQTGNNKLQMRPIIFVNIYEDTLYLPERLVRLAGNVQAGSISGAGTADPTDDSFRLCELEFISQSAGPSMGDATSCVKVYVDASTSLFDDMGAAADFTDITDGESLTAIGFIVESDDAEAFLGLNSVVVELGPRQSGSSGGWNTRQGVVADDPVVCDATDQCFNFDPDDTDPMMTVATRMRPETRVFRADGVELNQGDVSTGDSGSVDAVLISNELQAALVVLANDASSGIVSGVLDSISGTNPYVLAVMSESGGLFNVCIDPGAGVILHVLVDDEAVAIFDLLDPAVLEIGSLIEAFGEAGSPPAGCDLNAEEILVEPPPVP
jgi:hypothetical protein